ncbi:hypothetical protein ACFSJ3_10430 [Corallincola platygyrae]|uniref:Uncharacterized protein n=1 Tax=Corallincola platygyrae TaxID=1193278 RepID=A0ABW4XNM8_9GAMM
MSETQPGDYYVYHNPDAWLMADSGCKVNKHYIPDAVSVEWKGQCIDGFAIGYGQAWWVESDGTTGYFQTCLQPEHPFSKCSMGGGRK